MKRSSIAVVLPGTDFIGTTRGRKELSFLDVTSRVEESSLGCDFIA